MKPRALFQLGEPPLTTTAKPSSRVAATLDASEDPRDLYRIWVPAHKIVRVRGHCRRTCGGAHLGPADGLRRERAHRRPPARPQGQSVRAGKKGFAAYVEVLLTGRSTDASYVLTVKAAKR